MGYTKLEDIKIGTKHTWTRVVTKEKSLAYREVSENKNPIHWDEEYAKKTQFGAPIMPGVMTFAMASGPLTEMFDDLNVRAALVSITARFRRPVKVGEVLTLEAEVVEKIPERNRTRTKLTAINQQGEIVMEGEMVDQLV